MSPKKDMSKSPLRQPGAIEQAKPVVRNFAQQDWNEAENEEEEEEDYEIGERKLASQKVVQVEQFADEEGEG